MGRRSFEIGSECISGLAQLANRDEPISNWLALPVAVSFGFLLG
jgi:hypothetical protein